MKESEQWWKGLVKELEEDIENRASVQTNQNYNISRNS
jgi:hypothetical protein